MIFDDKRFLQRWRWVLRNVFEVATMTARESVRRNNLVFGKNLIIDEDDYDVIELLLI